MLADQELTFNRVVLTPLDEDHDTFIIDVVLDMYGAVVARFPTSGIWGKWLPDYEDVWLFIFRPNPMGRDRLDFGAFPKHFTGSLLDVDRFGESNLSSKPVLLGEYATVWVGRDEYCCRITAIKALLDKCVADA